MMNSLATIFLLKVLFGYILSDVSILWSKMIDRVIEILTLVTLLVPFTYLFKVIMNLKIKVALLEVEIEIVLTLLKKR